MADNSVDILLTARDEASSEINKASDSTKGLNTSMQGANTASAGLGGGMKGMIGPLALVAGGLLAAKAASAAAKMAFKAFTDNISQSIENWAVQEEAMRGNSAELQAMAGDFQMLTNIGDEVILNQMQVARGMGVTDEEMRGVTKTAIALSEMTGKDLSASMKLAAKGTEGQIEALQAQFPAMKHMTTMAEKQAFANEKLAEGYAQAQQGTDTLGGAMKSLGNNWGDILEKMGQLLAPFVKQVASWFNRIAPIVQSTVEMALPFFEFLSERMTTIAAFIGEKLVYAFSLGEAVVENWQLAVIAYVQKVIANHITLFEEIKYTFTDRIPKILTWFSENFMAIFRDMFVMYITMWKNRIAQIVDMWNLLWEVIQGKHNAASAMYNVGEIAGRSMLDGFVATTKELPDLMDRQMTASEKAAHDAAATTFAPILEQADKKFKDRMAGFKEMFKGKPGEKEAGWEEIEFAEKTKPFKLKKDKVTADKAKAEKEKGGFGALAASEGRLLSRGRVTEAQQQLKAQEDSKKLLEELKKLTEKGLKWWEQMASPMVTEQDI